MEILQAELLALQTQKVAIIAQRDLAALRIQSQIDQKQAEIDALNGQ